MPKTEYTERDPGQVETHWRPLATTIAARIRAQGAAHMARKVAELDDKLSLIVENVATSPWHDKRAAAVDRPLPDKLGECETRRGMITTCGRRCRPKLRVCGCGSWKVCAKCANRRQRKNFARASEAMRAHGKTWRARSGWATWYMLTLTVAHSGDVMQDADTLRRGWRRYWRWFRDHHKQELGTWSPPYLTTHEITNGDDGKGHYHLHCAFLFPRAAGQKVDYAASHEAWRRITADLGNASCILDYRTGQNKRTGAKTESHTPEAAAAYIAKHSVPTYAAKGSVSAGLTDELLSQFMLATYGKRLLHTSTKFWLSYSPLCPCCSGRLHHLVGHIESILHTWAKWSTADCDDDS